MPDSELLIPKVKEIVYLGTYPKKDVVAVTRGTIDKINLLIQVVNELIDRENNRIREANNRRTD